MRPTQPHIQWDISPWVKQPERQANQSPPSNAKLKYDLSSPCTGTIHLPVSATTKESFRYNAQWGVFMYLLVNFTLQSRVVTICTTMFNIQKSYIVPTQFFFCVLYVDLRTNSDYFTVQH